MSRRSFCCLIMVLAGLCCVTEAGRLAADDLPATAAGELEQRTKTARRGVMQRFANSLDVARRNGEKDDHCTLVKEPVMYFSDPVYHPEIGEGTMWIWKCEGRPQVISEVYNWGPKDHWTAGLYSFATARLSITDEHGLRRGFRPTDFQPQKVSDSPLPAASQKVRTRQMSQIAQRFRASERQASWNAPDRPRTELRLLAQPIYRYEDESLGILDGAVFVFAHGGTNAQIAMLLEVQSGGAEKPYWTAGFGRLNVGENHVLLDDRPFWTEPEMERPIPSDHPSNYIRKVIPWSVEAGDK